MSYNPTPSLFCNSGLDQIYSLKGTGVFPATFNYVLFSFLTEYIQTPPTRGIDISIGTDGTGSYDTGNGGFYIQVPLNSDYNSGIAVSSRTGGSSNFTSSPSISGVTAGLHQWLISISIPDQTIQVFYDGVLNSFGAGTSFHTTLPVAINNSINVNVNATTTSALADIYANFTSSFFDLTIPVNLLKFWNAGPVDLGPTGALPTGSAPNVYLTTRPNGPRSSIQTNLGTAGGILTFNHSGLVPFVSDGCGAPIYPNGGIQTQLIGAGGP